MMGCATKVLAFAVLVISTLSTFEQHLADGAPVVPCYFIIGDSLADNGNNNNLNTKAKANYPPYGVDLPGVGSSGRFTNGKTTVDLIAEKLGFTDFILSHATAGGQDLLRGVNYASASSGILDMTGSNLGQHISLKGQLNNHRNVVAQIGKLMGNPTKTAQLLNSCLYTVGVGSNDYINNYFLPGSSTKSSYSVEQYASYIIYQYTLQLEYLHLLGARKVALFGPGLIGCTPFARVINKGNCMDEWNIAVKVFNDKFKLLIDGLNLKFTDSKFIHVNLIGMVTSATTTNDTDTITAIADVSTSCCPITDTGVCTPNLSPCTDRSTHAFFDGFHPTEAANQMTAARAFHATSNSDTYPTDISHLVQP